MKFLAGVVSVLLVLHLTGNLRYDGHGLKYWGRMFEESVDLKRIFEDCVVNETDLFFAGHDQMDKGENWMIYRQCKCEQLKDDVWCGKDPFEAITVNNKRTLECVVGRCPEFYSEEVDGDGEMETVVIVPTAMTQGAGEIWVIDNGEVVFRSEELMRVNYKSLEAGDGFYILYGTEVNSINNAEWALYKYKDGAFEKVSVGKL